MTDINYNTFEEFSKKKNDIYANDSINISSDNVKLVNKLNTNKLIGQDHAVKLVFDAVKRANLGFDVNKKPRGSFLFCGPTGVGKTELAKCLTETLFGDRDKLIRFDMSEFMESHSVSKFLGTSPGYVGYDSEAMFSSISESMSSVILFDEIEKAHPKIMDIFLQILDEGCVKNAKGNKIYFTNSIIIFTSNIGANEIFTFCKNKKNISSTDLDHLSILLKDKLINRLRPEFVNRFDDVVVFKPLTEESIRLILKNLLSEKKDLLNTKFNLHLSFDSSVYDFLIKKGFSLSFGARQIKRTIQHYFDNEIATLLYSRFPQKNEITVSVDLHLDKLVFI